MTEVQPERSYGELKPLEWAWARGPNPAMGPRAATQRFHDSDSKHPVAATSPGTRRHGSTIALAHGLNTNLVHGWLRRAAGATSPTVIGEFVAVPLPAAPSSQPPPETAAPLPDIRIEFRRGATTITVSWPMAGASECGEWLHQWLK